MWRCCRRRQEVAVLYETAAYRNWRRIVIRKLIGRQWHFTGELLKAALCRALGIERKPFVRTRGD